MAYTQTTWAHDTPITDTLMDHMETQYTEAYADASAHTHNDRYYTKTECDAWFWHAGNDGSGSGCDADLLYHASGNKHFADFASAGVSAGIIILWDQAAAPAGWAVCDGTGGTVDLRECYVLGAGGSYSPGATGGSNLWIQNYTLSIAYTSITTTTMPAHTHTWTERHPVIGGSAYGGASITGSQGTVGSTGYSTGSTGSGTAHTHEGSYVTINWTENKPASVALHYIQKT
jgi:hypothetical protein